MAIFNANLEVTKATVQGGEIKDLEINGQNIELGSEVPMDANKEQTINVSTYTQPVVITPSSGKKGMKKATVTLSNIPSGESKLCAWTDVELNKAIYKNIATSPDDLTAFNASKILDISNLDEINVVTEATYIGRTNVTSFEKISETSYKIIDDGDEYTFTRDDTKDITLW